jgi:hypothetical protein
VRTKIQGTAPWFLRVVVIAATVFLLTSLLVAANRRSARAQEIQSLCDALGGCPEPGNWFRIFMLPPVGSQTGSARLNCGWHGTCRDVNSGGPTPGHGLDWDDEDGDGTCCSTGRNTYFRARVIQEGKSSPSAPGWVQFRSWLPSEICHGVDAEIREFAAGQPLRGVYEYVHSNNPSTTTYLLWGDGNGEYMQPRASSMVTNERTYCPWDGVHLHASHRDGVSQWEARITVGRQDQNSIPAVYDPSCLNKPYCAATYTNPSNGPVERSLEWYIPSS